MTLSPETQRACAQPLRQLQAVARAQRQSLPTHKPTHALPSCAFVGGRAESKQQPAQGSGDHPVTGIEMDENLSARPTLPVLDGSEL